MATIRLNPYRFSALSLGLLIFFFILFSVNALYAGDPSSKPLGKDKLAASIPPDVDKLTRVFLILINDVTFRDLLSAETPNLIELMDSASIAALSNRTAMSRSGSVLTSTTLGAGNRANASGAAASALNTFEQMTAEGQAAEIFFRRTGYRTGSNKIAHIGISTVKKDNIQLPYNVKIGLLGDELKKQKVLTAVFGNADRGIDEDSRRREAVIIAADRKGLVNYGDISSKVLKQDSRRPYGIRTDYDAIAKSIDSLPPENAFVVIETGDTSRADAYSYHLSADLFKQHQNMALNEADDFIGKLTDRYGFKDTLYIVASTTPSQSDKREQLTPLIMFGKDIAKGTLRSGTTRRNGIITLSDITATILKSFTPDLVMPSELAGRPVQVNGTVSSLEQLDKINQQALRTDLMRPVMVLIYILLQVAAFIISGLVLWFGNFDSKLFGIAKALLVIVLSIPASFFLSAILSADFGYAAYVAILLGLVLIISLSMMLFKETLTRLLAISALTYVVVLADIILGGKLNMSSILGYSPIIAGRFYGIGNQAMSILLASSLALVVSLLDMRKLKGLAADILQVLIFSVALVVVGAPFLGANTGGTVTLLAAYWATYVYIKKKQFRLADAGKAVATLAGFFIIAIGADIIFNSGSESHLSRLAMSVATSGPLELLLTIKRKILTNMRIFRYSSWSYLFILVLIVLSMLRFKPIGGLSSLFKKYPAFYAAATGCFVGSVIGFLTNDSGMSVPALILSYFLPIILYLMLNENSKLKREVK